MAPKKAFLLLNVHVHKMNLWHLCEGFFWGRLYKFNLIPNENSNKQIVNHNFTAFFSLLKCKVSCYVRTCVWVCIQNESEGYFSI